jgi:hypothetical protein
VRFTIQRFHEGALVTRMDDLDHDIAKGIIEIVWGVVPDTLKTGGELGEEWKLSLGEGHFVVATRTA